MKKLRTALFTAKDDLFLFPHTWTEGESYEMKYVDGACSLQADDSKVVFSEETIKDVARLFIVTNKVYA